MRHGYHTEHAAVCDDCAYLIANGDTPAALDHEGARAWLDSLPDLDIEIGHCHEDDYGDTCPTWSPDHFCQCEGWFSWSACGYCGTTLGGTRHAATILSPILDD